MGLQDRDYMRERQRRDNRDLKVFSPPEPSTKLTLWIILFWVALTFACFKGWTWWQLRQTPAATVRSTSVFTPATIPSKADPNLAGNWDRNRTAPAYSAPAPLQGTVQAFTKCVSGGVTSYTDGECDRNAKKSIVLVNPAENLADGLRQPSRAPVPPPQIVHVDSDTEHSLNTQLQKKLLCEQYEEEIKRIDAMARQPLPGSEQDRLSAQRKKGRDQQFRLRC
jgi:hypothetical protein